MARNGRSTHVVKSLTIRNMAAPFENLSQYSVPKILTGPRSAQPDSTTSRASRSSTSDAVTTRLRPVAFAM